MKVLSVFCCMQHEYAVPRAERNWIRLWHWNYKRETQRFFPVLAHHCTSSFVVINISTRVSMLYSLNTHNHWNTCLLTCHSRSSMQNDSLQATLDSKLATESDMLNCHPGKYLIFTASLSKALRHYLIFQCKIDCNHFHTVNSLNHWRGRSDNWHANCWSKFDTESDTKRNVSFLENISLHNFLMFSPLIFLKQSIHIHPHRRRRRKT